MNERGHNDGSPAAVARRERAAMQSPIWLRRAAERLLECADRAKDPAEAARLRSAAERNLHLASRRPA